MVSAEETGADIEEQGDAGGCSASAKPDKDVNDNDTAKTDADGNSLEPSPDWIATWVPLKAGAAVLAITVYIWPHANIDGGPVAETLQQVTALMSLTNQPFVIQTGAQSQRGWLLPTGSG